MDARINATRTTIVIILVVVAICYLLYQAIKERPSDRIRFTPVTLTQPQQPPPLPRPVELPPPEPLPTPPPMPQQPIVQFQRQEPPPQRQRREPQIDQKKSAREQERQEAIKSPVMVQMTQRTAERAGQVLEIPSQKGSGKGGNPYEMNGTIYKPGSEFVLPVGRAIPAVLVTGVETQVQGLVVAKVTEDVFDFHNKYRLIPANAELHGLYSNQVFQGQNRLDFEWQRVRFPDNSSMPLPKSHAVDNEGFTGIQGSVNNHLGQVFLRAALLTTIGAGISLSQNGGTFAGPFGAYSAGSVIGNSAGQEFGRTASGVVQQGLNIPPTVTVSPGTPILVMPAQDIVFQRPWTDVPGDRE